MKLINGNTMVEVFKTNVQHTGRARVLIARIHKAFPGYKANFDLDDCDRILRVACICGDINAPRLIGFLKHLGIHAEVLADDVASPQPYNALYMEN